MLEPLESRLTPSSGWTDADIGAPGKAGSASFNSTTGQWTVQGGGSDIWNTSDQFNFNSRSLSGDGSIISYVGSLTNTSSYAKAGVMIRNDNSAGSAFADMVVTPSNSLTFQWRSAAGASASALYADGIINAPIWVQLTRTGNVFTGSYSYDGANWLELGTGQAIPMNPTALTGLAVSAVNNAALNTATFSNVSVIARGWNDQDIGNPGVAGAAAFTGSTWTVAGGGSDIWGSWDQFHFSSQTFLGDVTAVAQVTGITNSGNYAKAGLMIRDGTAGNASYAFVFVNPNNQVAGEGSNFEYRNGTGTNSASAGSAAGLSAPEWVKLVRAGNTFTAYYSADGVNWTQDGTSQTIPMSPTVNVGIAVSANNASGLNTATFANVSIVPTGWNDQDIGGPGASGSAAFDGLSWTVSGGGSDIWNTADQFNYASRSYVGDGTIQTRVTSELNPGPYAKAGVMFRDGTAAGAGYAFLFLEPQGISFEYRNGSGAAAQGAGSATGFATPLWLKLVRAGNLFSAYYSGDGQAWTQLGATATVAMNATAQAGLAVDGHSATALNAATFDNVQIGPQLSDPFLAQNGVNIRNGHGNGDTVPLRGTNIGAWLFHEPWFSGMDGSGLQDAWTVYNTLTNRFGVAGRNEIYDTYQFDWITTTDLDDMRAMGMNALRIPFWWLNLVEPNGTWRADAFTHLDWIVNEAWKRGIYTILDFHGMPGGAATFVSSGDQRNLYWGSTTDQQLAATIWTNIAAHFAGNPAVAGYDLINEPAGAPNTATIDSNDNTLFWTVRNADPTHMIFVEGWGPADYSSLPPPWQNGWTNVVYEVHEYAWDGSGFDPTVSNIQGVTNYAVSVFQNSENAGWNIPMWVGEFSNSTNSSAGGSYERNTWSQNGISWNNWFWKNATGSQGDVWGDYAPRSGTWLPNLQTDSMSTILAAYATQGTGPSFVANGNAVQAFGMPNSVADSYQTPPGQSLYVAPASGVMANDTDPNTGQSGLNASLVSGVSHGTVILWPDGSFNYAPAPGFVGTDTFRYRAADANVNSANIARVALVVSPEALPAGWSDADVNSPALTGWASYHAATQTWTVASGGSDIWNSADQFNLASQSYTGDGTIIARVASETATDPWAKAGVMFRNDATPGSAFAAVLVTPGNGVGFYWRSSTGGPAGVFQISGVAAPVWVQVVRWGTSFSGFYSTDGVHWTQLGTAQTIAMSQTAQVGLAVTSHNSTLLNTSTFSNVSINPGQVTHFTLSVPAIATAGAPFAVMVTANDALGDVATTYSGHVGFTSTDGQAVLPAASALTNGMGLFLVTLKTVGAGSQTVTASDGTVQQTSGPIPVTPAATSQLVLGGVPASILTSTPFALTVTAKDFYGNITPAYTGTIKFTSSDPLATALGGYLPANYTFTGSGGDKGVHPFTPGVTFLTAGAAQTVTVTDTFTNSITGTSSPVHAFGLQVQSVVGTPTGFTVNFNEPFLLSSLHFFGTGNTTPPDVRFYANTIGAPLDGSLVVNAAHTSFTFVESTLADQAGGLPEGTYVVSLLSSTAALTDINGMPLDASNSPNSGPNQYPGNPPAYTTTFSLNTLTNIDNTGSQVAISLPACAQGPGAVWKTLGSPPPGYVSGIPGFVNVPVPFSNPVAYYGGIPVTISDGNRTTTASFQVSYNTALLTVTGALPDSATLANYPGATFTRTAGSVGGGIETDTFTFNTHGNPLATGQPWTLGELQAVIPNNPGQTIYQAKQLLPVTNIALDAASLINGGNVLGGSGFQVVAYLGDGSGDGQLTTTDAALANNVALHHDTGFAAYPLVDPVVLADTDDQNTVDGTTVSNLAFVGAGHTLYQIPTPPNGAQVGQAAPDPDLGVPLAAVPRNGVVRVPVTLDNARPAGSTGLTSATLGLQYDPKVLSVTAADVHLGSLPGLGTGWTESSVIDAPTGQLVIELYSLTPINVAAAGSLVTVDFHLLSGASSRTTVTLVSAVNPGGGRWFNTNLADTHGALVLGASTGVVNVMGLAAPAATSKEGVAPIPAPETIAAAALPGGSGFDPVSAAPREPERAVPAEEDIPGMVTLVLAIPPAEGGFTILPGIVPRPRVIEPVLGEKMGKGILPTTHNGLESLLWDAADLNADWLAGLGQDLRPGWDSTAPNVPVSDAAVPDEFFQASEELE